MIKEEEVNQTPELQEVDIVDIADEPIEPEYSLCYAIYCLLLFSGCACFTVWTKGAMASFYGFGVEGKADNPKYAMKLEVTDLDPQTYAQYIGLWFTVAFIPSLLLGGPLIQNLSKIKVLGWCTALSGLMMGSHSLVTSVWQCQIMIAICGVLQGLSVSIAFQYVTEFFPQKYKTRAFYIFSMSEFLGESMKFMSPIFIAKVGWRTAWAVGGSFGFITGVLLACTVSEPISKKQVVLASESHQKEVVEEANKLLKQSKNSELEIKKVGKEVVVQKKQTTIGGLLKTYTTSFGLILTNKCAMVLITACFFKLWQATTFSFFLNEYMKCYQQEYKVFSAQASVSALFSGVITTFISGAVVDYFGPKSDMTIPMLCVVKTSLLIPILFLVFY